MELDVFQTSVRRIIKNDLRLRPYKIVIKPLLFNNQKIKQKIFAKWLEINFRKAETMKILFFG